jgi:putative transposase
MPRIPRVVVPGLPHYIARVGNLGRKAFFCETDFRVYRCLQARHMRDAGVKVLTCCLLPKRSDMIGIPSTEDGLIWAMTRIHQPYTWKVNRREGRAGYLWGGRFTCFPLDGEHLEIAVRYILTGPVRAGLVEDPGDWPHSSARAHLEKGGDLVAWTGYLDGMIEDWKEFLEEPVPSSKMKEIERHIRSGRPLGSDGFVRRLEERLGRRLRSRKRGRKPILRNVRSVGH